MNSFFSVLQWDIIAVAMVGISLFVLASIVWLNNREPLTKYNRLAKSANLKSQELEDVASQHRQENGQFQGHIFSQFEQMIVDAESDKERAQELKSYLLAIDTEMNRPDSPVDIIIEKREAQLANYYASIRQAVKNEQDLPDHFKSAPKIPFEKWKPDIKAVEKKMSHLENELNRLKEVILPEQKTGFRTFIENLFRTNSS